MRIGQRVQPKYAVVKIVDFIPDTYSFRMSGDATMTATRYMKNKKYGGTYASDEFDYPVAATPFNIDISSQMYEVPQYRPKKDHRGQMFHKIIDGSKCKLVLPRSFQDDGRYYFISLDKGLTIQKQAAVIMTEDVTDYAMSFVDTTWESSHFSGELLRAFNPKIGRYYPSILPDWRNENVTCVVGLPNHMAWWINSYHLKTIDNEGS